MSNSEFNQVSLHQKQALNNLRSIYDYNALALSTKQKVILAASFNPVPYFSYVAAKMYLIIGSEGTQYLPFGNFSRLAGGISAFLTNLVLQTYFAAILLYTSFLNYSQYKFAKKKGANVPPLWQLFIKLLFGVVCSLTVGFVFFTIARNASNDQTLSTSNDETSSANSGETSLYDFLVTGAFNAIQSYLGCVELVNLYFYVKQKFAEWRSPQKALAAKEKAYLLKKFSHTTQILESLPNDDGAWNQLTYFQGYINFVLNQRCISKTTPFKTQFKKVLSTSLLVILVVSSFVSCAGLLLDTISGIPSESPYKRIIFGNLSFLPFAALSLKVTWETKDIIVNLLSSGTDMLIQFTKNPNWSKQTCQKLFIYSCTTALITIGYGMSYVSSDSSLELNHKYGHEYNLDFLLNTMLSDLLTIGGVMIFNGISFLTIFTSAANWLTEQLFYSPEKRDILGKHQDVTRFFEEYSFKKEPCAHLQSPILNR